MTTKKLLNRLIVAIATVAGTFAVTSHVGSPSGFTDRSERSLRSRRLSVALPNGGCEVTPAVAPKHAITPTFTASYPGSGAKMTWNLIEALTGLVTGDEWNLNGHQNMVTIKSHYPHEQGNKFHGAEQIPRAILLLRNPLNAMPSYLNYLYEVENHLGGHSTRAPLEVWIKWRDENFDKEIQTWRQHTEYWMDQYPPDRRLVLSYEGIISDVGGPIFATKLADFLAQSEGVTVIDRESVPCVWETVIKYKGSAAQGPSDYGRRNLKIVPGVGGFSESNPAAPESHRSGNKIHPYTKEQLDSVLNILQGLKERYSEIQFTQTVDAYVQAVNGVKAGSGFS